jgi:hypothetical protein
MKSDSKTGKSSHGAAELINVSREKPPHPLKHQGLVQFKGSILPEASNLVAWMLHDHGALVQPAVGADDEGISRRRVTVRVDSV